MSEWSSTCSNNSLQSERQSIMYLCTAKTENNNRDSWSSFILVNFLFLWTFWCLQQVFTEFSVKKIWQNHKIQLTGHEILITRFPAPSLAWKDYDFNTQLKCFCCSNIQLGIGKYSKNRLVWLWRRVWWIGTCTSCTRELYNVCNSVRCSVRFLTPKMYFLTWYFQNKFLNIFKYIF